MKAATWKGRKGTDGRGTRQKPSAVGGLILPPGSTDIKVRLGNSQGKYLSAGHGVLTFSADCAKALVLDYLADGVEQYIRLVAQAGGPLLRAIAVDPGEFLERCERCARHLEAVDAFFDGRAVLCPQCRRT